MAQLYTTVIQWDAEEKVFMATHPELPGCVVYGETVEEALASLNTLSELWLQEDAEQGHDRPSPIESHYSGRLTVRIPKSLHRQLALRAVSDGVTLNQLIMSILSGSPAPSKAVEVSMKLDDPSTLASAIVGLVQGTQEPALRTQQPYTGLKR